jgi:hypothetical protein
VAKIDAHHEEIKTGLEEVKTTESEANQGMTEAVAEPYT